MRELSGIDEINGSPESNLVFVKICGVSGKASLEIKSIVLMVDAFLAELMPRNLHARFTTLVSGFSVFVCN